ncbi:MAG: hypothetical protein QM744_08640 [Mesorhizobium sp.]
MHIAVILRLIPDLSEELELDASGKDIDREWIGVKLCEFDDHALEEAVLLKERSGARVTAIALAGEGIDRQLQTAVARGADVAVRIDHELVSANDSRGAAQAIAEAVKKLAVDLVFTGIQTPEDVFGQLAPYLAGVLDWPTVNAVSAVSIDGGIVLVKQEYSGGRSATLKLQGPGVLGIQSASQPPRYVSGTKLRQASATPIEAIAGGTAATPRAHIDELSTPQRGQGAAMIPGNADAVAARIADLLSERGLIGA